MFTSSKRLIFPAMLLISCIIGDATAQSQGKLGINGHLFQAVELANSHCQKLSKLSQKPYALVEAFKKHYQNDDFAKKMTDAQRLDLLEYFEGRKNLPDFGFIIPRYESQMPREARVKFNALVSLKILESLGAEANAENCETTNFDDDFDTNSYEMQLKAQLNGTPFSYNLVREEGYLWQIDDIQIGATKSLAEQHRGDYSAQISQGGFDVLIQNLCNNSSFSRLGCED